jgi:hypothetical protein
MNGRKEELKAAALWAFVERLRGEENPLAAGLDGLTPADAEELSALLRMAESLRLALDSTEVAPSAPVSAGGRPIVHPRAAARVQAAIAARRGPEPDCTPRSSSVSRPRTGRAARSAPGSPPWWLLLGRHRWTAGFAAAALVVGVLVGRSLPASDPLTYPPPAVAALTHEQVRSRVPRLMAGRLATAEARAVLWHLAHCDDCFAAYRMMSRPSQHRSHQPALCSLALRAFNGALWRLRPRGSGGTNGAREGAFYEETPIP